MTLSNECESAGLNDYGYAKGNNGQPIPTNAHPKNPPEILMRDFEGTFNKITFTFCVFCIYLH
jgi:hypothetical protein